MHHLQGWDGQNSRYLLAPLSFAVKSRSSSEPFSSGSGIKAKSLASNQLRLWFSAFAHLIMSTLQAAVLKGTELAVAS